jgi:hypothetical protein
MINKVTNNRQNINEKIATALASRNMGAKALPVSELNQIVNPNSHVQNFRQQRTKYQSNKLKTIECAKNKTTYDQAIRFAGQNGNIYITFGGVGDLVLLLAECYQDKDAKVIFFANASSKKFGESFLNFFNIKNIILPNIMGSMLAPMVVEHFKQEGRLKPSSHLPTGLDYGDWKNNIKTYEEKITSNTNWIQEIGKVNTTENIAVIAPSGSFRDVNRQRYLIPDEYLVVVSTLLKHGYEVYTVGSQNDIKNFPWISHTKHFWLMADKTLDYKKNEKPHDFGHFLKTINAASSVISVDTWLKTYTLICGIDTNVILNRRNKTYIPHMSDISDYVFLNTNIWPHLKVCQFDELIENLK